MAEQGARDADPWEKKVEREQVRISRRMRVRREEVQTIVEGEEEGDDDALRNLDTVDASKHVDALGAEHGNTGHVNVVKCAKVEELAQIRLELKRQNNGCDVKVDKVDNQKGDRGNTRNPPLVSPANVKEIITDTQEGNCLKRDDGAQKRGKL